MSAGNSNNGITADDLARMRPGSLFVNTSRAGLVAPGALLAALGARLDQKRLRDAREHGVEVRDVDINLSDWDATLEAGAPAAGRPCRFSQAKNG